MLIFKLETDEKILSENTGSIVYTAIENNVRIARAYLKTDMLFCDVYKLEYPKDRLYIAQGLLRACYNYAANMNIYMGKLSDKNCEDVAKSMNFIFDGTSYVNDIPTLLIGNCCCEDEFDKMQ